MVIQHSDTVIRGTNYISAQAFQYLFNKLGIEYPELTEILMCVGDLHLEIFSILSGDVPIPQEWIVSKSAIKQAIELRDRRQTRRITW